MFPLVITVGNMFPSLITVGNTFPPLATVGNTFPLVITVGNTFPFVITVENKFPLVITAENTLPLVTNENMCFCGYSAENRSSILSRGFNFVGNVMLNFLKDSGDKEQSFCFMRNYGFIHLSSKKCV